MDSLDQGHTDEANSGIKGLKTYLDEAEENSSSSPEEIEIPVATGPGVDGLRDILERTDRERSSSGEEWEKVSPHSVPVRDRIFVLGEHHHRGGGGTDQLRVLIMNGQILLT